MRQTSNSSVGFWTSANDGGGRPSLTIAVDTETGKPISLTFRDRESLEPLAVAHIHAEEASAIGQALLLAAAMKGSEGGTE